MNYYFWTCGYENCGVVKANTTEEAKNKLESSQGKYFSKKFSIYLLDDEFFDEYDVAVLSS